jgi:hypothetical protein
MMRTIAAASFALLATLTLVTLAPASAENGFHDLTGEFYVVEEMEGMAPTMFIGLTGEAAQTLYETISVEAESNECMGGLMKTLPDGGYCTFDEAAEGDKYFCSFSFDLKSGKFTGGESC